MERGKVGKTEAERHRDASHASAKINLELALKSLDEAFDWIRSWPNNITNLESDVESLINRLRIILRTVAPVETDGHVRVLPGIPDDRVPKEKVIVIGDG